MGGLSFWKVIYQNKEQIAINQLSKAGKRLRWICLLNFGRIVGLLYSKVLQSSCADILANLCQNRNEFLPNISIRFISNLYWNFMSFLYRNCIEINSFRTCPELCWNFMEIILNLYGNLCRNCTEFLPNISIKFM